MIPDWELMHRARDGDESAWRELTRRHRPRLIKLCLLIARDMQASEDITEETLLRLLHYGREQEGGSFSSLTSTIAYRAALKERSKQKKLQPLEGVERADNEISALDHIMKSERDIQLMKAIHSLDESHRDILILRFYGDHSYEEISKLTSLPLGTVKSRIFYAVKHCRELLKDEGFMP
jgi:RNA polymerase sigma factor (sigma-70 family)